MAATRLITMHEAKGKSLLQSLSDRIDYSQNPAKTRDGDLISSYCCNPCTAASEFLLSKQEYLRITGRRNRGDIIAYQIRQSFLPGEISPEEANRVGYETAMRFTKGEHAFTVSTHIDRHHIHNHIIFNSTSLDCTKDVYKQYQKTGYNEQFFEDHRQEILLHRAAKQAFDTAGLQHLPRIKDLNNEYKTLIAGKKKAYSEYRSVRDRSREYSIARKNVEIILGYEEAGMDRKQEIEQNR